MSLYDQTSDITLHLRNTGRQLVLPSRRATVSPTRFQLPQLAFEVLVLLHLVEDFFVFFEFHLVGSLIQVLSRTYCSAHSANLLTLLQLFGSSREATDVFIESRILHQGADPRRLENTSGREIVGINTHRHSRVIFLRFACHISS